MTELLDTASAELNEATEAYNNIYWKCKTQADVDKARPELDRLSKIIGKGRKINRGDGKDECL